VTKRKPSPPDAEERILSKLIDAGIINDTIRMASNVLTSMAQAAAANPIVGAGVIIILADLLQKFKIITPNGSALAIGAVVGLGAAKGMEGIVESFAGVLPFSSKNETTDLSLRYDIPDFPAIGPGRPFTRLEEP
jgi:hypothetical protein